MSRKQFTVGTSIKEVGWEPGEDEYSRTVPGSWIANAKVTQILYALITKHNPSKEKHPLKPNASVTWWEGIYSCNQLQWVLGNVWELWWDLNAPSPNDPDPLPKAISQMDPVVYGGSWLVLADIFRPANRSFVDPNNRTDTIVFRLADSTPVG